MPEPIYRSIADDLRHQIETGELAPAPAAQDRDRAPG